MEFLKLFQTHQEYEAFVSGDTMVKPNVSLCEQENEVHYNPILHDYSKDYLTFVALEDGIISFTLFSWADTTFVESFAYSKNDGEWVETQNSDDRENDIKINVNVVEGDKVRWKGVANHIGCEDGNGGVFTSTCRVNTQGNIMSLLCGDYFNNELTLGNDFVFSSLFTDISSGNENKCLIVNASDLVLPATTLANNCYAGMFADCTNLTTAPVLPATTLADGCYVFMFSRCTSLTTAPVLPATTLADGCYEGMFQDCTSLTTAPELPITTLADGCYSQMFYGCTSLTVAPELPATILVQSCYSYMFYGCTSLTVAPELSATTLTSDCYSFMFMGCRSLNYIKAMFTTTPSGTYTNNWVSNVAATGTFVKNAAATWTTTGVNGIPTGWTVETATA